MSTWQAVIHRANSDAQFRDQLKSNPAVACKMAGVDVPAGSTVKIIERQPTEVYLILNPLGGGELDDAQLEAVAGGTDPLRLLAQVSHLQAESAAEDLGKGSSAPTTTPTTPPKQPTTPKRPRGIT